MHRPPGITVEAIGGLGNQLFVFAVGRALAAKNDCPLYVDKTWYLSADDRTYQLRDFTNPAIDLDDRGRGRKTGRRCTNVGRRVRNRIPRGLSSRMTDRLFVERGFSYDPAVLALPPGTRLRGFFQSWRYFQEIGPVLRQEILSLTAPSTWYSEMKRESCKEDEWIAIHVRRGDYMMPFSLNYHGIVQREYYARALRLVFSLIGEQRVVVFSDDPNAASELLSGLSPSISHVRPPAGASALESIALMSEAKAVITANSSFSWWAAWLGDRAGRPVIAPRPWFDGVTISENDLLLPTWLSVGKETV